MRRAVAGVKADGRADLHPGSKNSPSSARDTILTITSTLTRTLTPAIRLRSGNNPFSLRARPSRKARGLQHACSLFLRSSDTRQRYCANLGHRQDDETGTYTGGSADGDGLVYMRARYYEPGTGRFLSEDPSLDGVNWFTYAKNCPAVYSDLSGKEAGIWGALLEIAHGILTGVFAHGPAAWEPKDVLKIVFKGAWGVQAGYLSKWAVEATKTILEITGEGVEAAEAMPGGGFAIDAIYNVAAYSILCLWAIDAIDVVGGEALADLIFENGKDIKKWIH